MAEQDQSGIIKTEGLPHVVKWVYDRCREEDGCYIWRQAVVHGKGRPLGRYKNKHISPQRAVYEAATGKVLGEKKIMLKCGEPRCCNPEHMVAHSHAFVMKDAAKRGVFPSGYIGTAKYTPVNRRRPHVKLNIERARKIHELLADNVPLKKIAEIVGIKYRHAWAVARGRIWRDSINSGFRPF